MVAGVAILAVPGLRRFEAACPGLPKYDAACSTPQIREREVDAFEISLWTPMVPGNGKIKDGCSEWGGAVCIPSWRLLISATTNASTAAFSHSSAHKTTDSAI